MDKYNDEGKRHIQAFGEQHPDFHSKEMKKYRAADKAKGKALKKKTEGKAHDTTERSLPKNVRHGLHSEIPEHLKDKIKKDANGNTYYDHS